MRPEELGKILVEMGESDETGALWNVLTALRGPDNEDEDVKRATTEVIRWHFLGKDPNMDGFSGSFVGPDDEGSRRLRVFLSGPSGAIELSHFRGHAKLAFAALGLKWDEVNT